MASSHRAPALFLCLFAFACSGESKPPTPSPDPDRAAASPAAAPELPRPIERPQPPPDPDEACGQIIVVAHKGAAHAKPGITRDKPAALARAEELLQKLRDGGDFVALARAESDAPASAPRGGVMGTYRKAEWPQLHMPLRDPLFALAVGQLAPAAIDADYGYVVLRRCAVEKAHARHILVRYKGAKNADASIKRSKTEAAARGRELLAELNRGADFADLARENSDDTSGARGGDLGTRGRGIFALPFEQALFALQPGQHSDLVESEFGYHIIERL